MKKIYLTTEELSLKIKYDPSTIREQLKDSVLFEGVYYIRPLGAALAKEVRATFLQITSTIFKIRFTHAT